LGPGGDGFVGAGLGGEAVAEVGVGEGMDALVLLRVPASEGIAVLLFGADVVGESVRVRAVWLATVPAAGPLTRE